MTHQQLIKSVQGDQIRALRAERDHLKKQLAESRLWLAEILQTQIVTLEKRYYDVQVALAQNTKAIAFLEGNGAQIPPTSAASQSPSGG